jgi:hypothetical protein
MNRLYLYDAYDYFKLWIIEFVKRKAGIDVKVLSLRTGKKWNRRLINDYAKSLGVINNKILRINRSFKSNKRRDYFKDLPTYYDDCIYCDPDSGLGSGNKCISLENIKLLLKDKDGKYTNRVVMVYHHHRGKPMYWLNTLIKYILKKEKALDAFGYESATVGMIFISRDGNKSLRNIKFSLLRHLGSLKRRLVQ